MVTSLAEVWIEILHRIVFVKQWQSLPLRKCGLKYFYNLNRAVIYMGHFPCGSVD